MKYVAIQCMFRLSFRMLRTDPNDIPIMSATLQRVVLLTLGPVSSLKLHFSPSLLADCCPELSVIFQRGHTAFKAAKSLKNVPLPYSAEPNRMQQCIKVLLFLILNEGQHVSGDTPPIIRSLKLHKQPLVSHTWNVVRCAVFVYAT